MAMAIYISCHFRQIPLLRQTDRCWIACNVTSATNQYWLLIESVLTVCSELDCICRNLVKCVMLTCVLLDKTHPSFFAAVFCLDESGLYD